MTKPASNEELSALLDGELSRERGSEIREAFAGDAALRAEYERLAKLNHNWSAAAEQARFKLSVNLQPRFQLDGRTFGMGVVGLTFLIAIRFVAKCPVSASWAVALHAVALGILAIVVTRLVFQSEDHPSY
jgi:anti-sigma factor RsiW